MPRRTLEDRLLQAAHVRFVGRDEPLRLFDTAIASAAAGDALPFNVINIHGPGGVGKTTLLQEFRFRSAERGLPSIYLDGQIVDPVSESFLKAIRNELGTISDAAPDHTSDPQAHLAEREDPLVLIIDTAEHLEPLADWLGRRFLPRLSSSILVVISGRNRMAGAFTSQPGWTELVRDIPLRNFSDGESREFLQRSGVDEILIDDVLRFTFGHPLALALAESVARQHTGEPLDLGSDKNMIKALLDRFVMNLPSPAHRAAVELSALARFTTEEMIESLIEGGGELFEWLRGQSFIQSGNRGLMPHDLARRVLAEDLRWRNPDWFAELHGRLRSWYNGRLEGGTAEEQQVLLADYVYLYRHKKIVRPFYEALKSGGSWEAGLRAEPARTDAQFGAILAMIEKHEGRASAAVAQYWRNRQPTAFRVVRNAAGDVRGAVVVLRLEPEDMGGGERGARLADADPAIPCIRTAIGELAPLRKGEHALVFRWWLAEDSYQDVSHVQMLVFIEATRFYLTSPRLAWSFFLCRDMDRWEMIFAWADLPRIRDLTFETGEQSWGAFGHDWRKRPPTTWLDTLAERDGGANPIPEEAEPDTIVLSEDAFEMAVLGALKGYARPADLTDNPLLKSRFVADELDGDGGTEARIEALRSLIASSAESLKGTRTGDKAWRAVERIYLKPAPSQEAAAEALDIPYSTFRRHLASGRSTVTRMLWDREIGD